MYNRWEAVGRLVYFHKIAQREGAFLNRFQYSFSKSPPPASGGAPCLTYISRDQYDPEEWSSSLHTHGCAELFFITDGHGKFLTQSSAFPVALHDMVIVNAGVPHTELSQAESPLQYIVLGVEGLEAMAGSDGYAMLHLHTGWKELMACLHLMLQEVYDALPGCEDACRHLLEVVLIRLERQRGLSFADESAGSRASRECDLVRRYIDNHFKENLTLDQLAQMAHLSKYYLVHAFRREFGASPISYLIGRRIEESRFLLRETDHTLSLIAEILGFSSLSYFSQCFRRVEGVSPMEYRKRAR